MNSSDAIDLAREALLVAFQIGAPILLVALVVSVLMGFMQGITQLHDSAIGMIPKILLVALAVGISLPWLTQRVCEYASEHWSKPITMMVQTSPSEH